MSFLELLGAVAPVFAIILGGFAIRRAGWLTAEADGSLLRVVVNLLYPCLILQTILGNAGVATPGNLVAAPLAGFATVALGYLLCYLAAPLLGIVEPRSRRTFAFTAGIYNYGYIALPLVQHLFQGTTVGVLFLHNVGVETAMWTAGIMMLTGGSPRRAWRHLLSVPVLALAGSLLLHFLGTGRWLPEFLLVALKALGGCAIPLGLLLTGAVFADQLKEGSSPVRGAVGLGAIVLRLGILPVLMLALAWALPWPREVRAVMIVQAAMPSAVVPVILARHYGADAATALRVVFATSALGLLTIPLWLQTGLRLLSFGHE